MTVTASKSKRPATSVAASHLHKQMAPSRTNEELLEKMRAHGREIRKTKESTVAFLHSAGIVDATGKLAKPYRG